MPLIPNMNQNVAVRTFLLDIKMDVFSILSATSDYTPHPVLKLFVVIIGIPSSGEFTVKEETDAETCGVVLWQPKIS